MQTSQYRNGNEFALVRDFWRLWVRNRRVTLQALVRPGHMIILFDELLQEPFQMTLAQHDHIVKDLSPQGADESLHERILPRASVGGTNLGDAAAVQEHSYAVAIEAVIVPEEILGLQAKGHRFTQLLNHPIHVRMSCHGKVYDLTSAVVEDEEDIQRGKVESRDGEEIDGPGYVHVITQKRQPCRRSVTRFSRPVHVLAYSVRTGRVVPEKNEGVVDPLGTPEGILLAELVNQTLYLLGNRRSPTVPTGLPSPEVPESPGMPFLDGRRLHQMGEVFPLVQTFREDDPEHPKARSEPWSCAFLRSDLLLTDGELALCGQESAG